MRIVLFLLTLALAIAPLATSAAEPPIEIPVVISLTGPAAFVGSQIEKAFGVFEASINSRGGIRGRPLKFTIQDDQSNAQVAVQLVGQLIAKNAPIVICGVVASTCSAPAGLLKESGPVLYCFSSAVATVPGSWVYSTSFATNEQLPAALRFVRQRGWTKVGFITTTDASGQDYDRYLSAALASPDLRSVSVVAHEHMGVSDLSVDAQVARIKAAGPQVVMAWAVGTPLGTILRSVQNAGIDVPILTSGANDSYTQLEGYRQILPARNLYLMGIPPLDPSVIRDRPVRAAIDEFNAAMKAAGLRGEIGSAIAWNTAMVIADAYRRTGPAATAVQLRDAINSTRKFAGVYGTLDYQESPQRGITSYWLNIVRWDPNGPRFIAVTKPGDLLAPK